MITNKEKLEEALKDIPKIENQMVSAMSSISVKELEEAVDRFHYIPSYEDLLEENNKFKNIIEELEKWLNDVPKYFMSERSFNSGVSIQQGMQYQIDLTKDKLQELKEGKK